MKTLIRIDRSTLKKNPTAGRTHHVMPTLRTGELSMEKEGREYQFVSVGRFEFSTERITGKFRCVGYSPGPNPPLYGFEEDYDLDLGYDKSTRVSAREEYQDYYTRPAPNWLFEYEPTPVICNSCGKQTPHNQLKTDTARDADGDERNVYDICPHCGATDCCDYEYEDAESVAKELGLK